MTRYELTPEKVDCVVFCSKDYRPILPRLQEITSRFNTYFPYTITAYGKEIEPGVPSIEKSMQTLIELSKLVGRQRITWRYDPVLLTREYTIRRHLKTFESIAQVLAPHIDRCIFSFVEMYKKLETNMPELIPLTGEDKKALAQGLGSIARTYGIYLQTCGTDQDYSSYGIHPSGCMTLDILGKANGISFKSRKHKGLQILLRLLYEALHRPYRAMGKLSGREGLACDQAPGKIRGQRNFYRLCHRPLQSQGGGI